MVLMGGESDESVNRMFTYVDW